MEKTDKRFQEWHKLKQELKEMKASHLWAWDQYGSELCAAEMMRKEKELEDRIRALEEV